MATAPPPPSARPSHGLAVKPAIGSGRRRLRWENELRGSWASRFAPFLSEVDGRAGWRSQCRRRVRKALRLLRQWMLAGYSRLRSVLT